MPTQVEMSGNSDIDGILWGWRWTNTNLTYSFPTGTAEYTDNGYDDVNGFQAFNASQQAACIKILANYDAVCNVNFTAADPGTVASLRFAEATSVDDGMNGLDTKETATGTPPDPNEFPGWSWGDMWFNPGNYDQTPDVGTYTYTAGIMHEIGHALGLKHGHTDQGVDHDDHPDHTFPALPANHDSQEYSIMTYSTYVGSDPNGGFTGEAAQTIMQNDIAALQYMYGANYGHNSGATTYTWNSTNGEMYINGVSQNLATGDHIFMTVWDGGGNDTYDFSNYSSDLEVNLNPGEWTTVSQNQIAGLGGGHDARGNIANALLYQGNTASLIENAVGGSGDDTMYGNQANNTLTGNGGADTLKGAGGHDTLNGGSGDDTLWGEDGADTLNGGGNNDSLKGGGGADDLNGGFGNDTAHYNDSNAGVTITLSATDTTTGSGGYAAGDDLNSIENVNGSEYADYLFGSSVDNVLNGNGGADYIKGGGGADTLDGGDGNDTASYYGSSAGVTVGLSGTGSGGDAQGDTLSDFENLVGSDHNDTLMGNGGVNTLNGSFGDDTLKGGGGADTLYGSNDNDTLKGGGGADALDGGSGVDTAIYSDSDAGVTVLLSSGNGFGGTAAGDTLVDVENVVGSGYGDWLSGNGSANLFDGGAGADVLDGNGGLDTVTYANSNAAVAVSLPSQTGVGGHAAGDSLFEIENLIGSAFDDQFLGTSGANQFDGGAGDDHLDGGAGGDELVGGTGIDTVSYAHSDAAVAVSLPSQTGVGGHAAGDGLFGIENLIGSAFDDQFLGGADANLFDGGAGADWLDGGAGIDTVTYSNSAIGVAVSLPSDSGVGGHAAGDTLLNIEFLIGSAFDDQFAGTAGVNKFNSGGGSDWLDGGAGSDWLDGGAGIDTVTYANSSAAVAVSLPSESGVGGDAAGDSLIDIENLVGSAFDDQFLGTSGTNQITGGAGADWLTGNGGNDFFIYNGSFGADVIFDFTAGAGATDVMQLDDAQFANFAAVLDATFDDGFGNTAIYHAAGQISLHGVVKAQLNADDFLFV